MRLSSIHSSTSVRTCPPLQIFCLSKKVLLKCYLTYFSFVVDIGNPVGDYQPDWGSMSFLIDFLRPTASEGPTWYSLLKKAEGGCNDLLYSGHMLVAVLTAMAWTVRFEVHCLAASSYHLVVICILILN